MGNNFCSICSNQTTLTEISKLSINLTTNKNNGTKKRIKILESFNAKNNESFISLNDLSFSQEIDNFNQSIYDFKNLIFLVDKKTKNIIFNNINKKTKIESEMIKDLFFICNYKDYNLYKNEGIFVVNVYYLKEIGIPDEIYKNKGLNYIKRDNSLEILFIKDMKMIRISSELQKNININHNNNSNNNINNTQINNINIIHNINNFNTIETLSKNLSINTPHFDEKTISKDIISTKRKNKNHKEEFISSNNSEISNSSYEFKIMLSSLDTERNNISCPELIFQTLLFLAEEENKLLKSLKSKINTNKIYEYYLINKMWLNKYKNLFNYNAINDLYKKNEKYLKDTNLKMTKNDIEDFIKNNPKVLDSIKNKLKDKKFLEVKDFRKLRFLINNTNYNINDKLKNVSLPYNFYLINKQILDLIIKQFDFKCINHSGKKRECNCDFCESNFLKKYDCYIGNKNIFISNRNKKNNYYHYYTCILKKKKYHKKTDFKIKVNYLFLFKNNETFINEINIYYSEGKNLKEYLKKKNLNNNNIIQDLFDINGKTIGQIINIKILLEQEEEIEFINQYKVVENSSRLRANTKRKKFSQRISIKNNPLLLYKKPSLIGLNRSGQPKFFNSILQCLSNIPELTNFFLLNNFSNEEKQKDIYPFSYHYSQLINELWRKPSEEDSEINNYPYYQKSFFAFQIKEFLLNLNSSVLSQQKNVFKELFLYIIKLLDNELNQFEFKKINKLNNINLNNNNNDNNNDNNNNDDNNKTDSSISVESNNLDNEEKLLKEFRDHYYKKYNSIIQRNFYSEIEVYFYCIKCETYNFHYEIINSFTFDLEKIKNNFLLKYMFKDVMKKTIILSLQECFENLEKPNQIEKNLTCKICNLNTLEKQVRIIKSPNILVFFFKEKDIQDIELDIRLDLQLNAYIHDLNEDNNENNNENNTIELKRNSYDLICVLCSPPEKTKKIKYLAYCKNPINKWWYCYNDSIVTNVDIQFLKNIKIPKMLIYRRKELIYLIFVIDTEQKLKLEVINDMFFKDVISYLYVKYKWVKKLNISYFMHKNKTIDIHKNVSQNNLKNGSIINCLRNNFKI